VLIELLQGGIDVGHTRTAESAERIAGHHRNVAALRSFHHCLEAGPIRVLARVVQVLEPLDGEAAHGWER